MQGFLAKAKRFFRERRMRFLQAGAVSTRTMDVERMWKSNLPATETSRIERPSLASAQMGRAQTPRELEAFSAEISEHLFDVYLPFWCGPALDPVKGGWMSWLSNDLKPDRTRPKGLITNAKILWAFSAAYRARPQPVFARMAEQAFEFTMSRFWDSLYGGVFWRLDDSGKVIDDSKKIRGQAFYMHALAEFHRAFGNQLALDKAMELFDLVERHAHDTKYGGYVETCRRNWSELPPDSRAANMDLDGKKSSNSHLHILEAYTNLHRVSRSVRINLRMQELIYIFLKRLFNVRTHHLHHLFNECWAVRSTTHTFGHDMEASWLLCDAAKELGDYSLFERVRPMALEMAGAVLNEGQGADGGIFHEGRNNAIVDGDREWWPQAEAMIGFLNAYEISGNRKFLVAARRVWDFAQNHLVDNVYGEWFWRVNPDGQPDPNQPKISELKGPYHVTRACIEAMKRLEQFAE